MKYKYATLALAGFTIWMLETAYFGYNRTAQSGIEHILDTISWIFIIWGVLGDILTNLKIEKTTHYDIHTKTVEVKEGNKTD